MKTFTIKRVMEPIVNIVSPILQVMKLVPIFSMKILLFAIKKWQIVFIKVLEISILFKL